MRLNILNLTAVHHLFEVSMMITSLMNTDGRKTTANILNNISKTDGAEDNSTINSI